MAASRGAKSNAAPARLRRRAKEWVAEKLDPVFAPLAMHISGGLKGEGPGDWMRYIPARPVSWTRWAPLRKWPEQLVANPPEALRSYAGAIRDDEAEDAAYAEQPLHDFVTIHPEAVVFTLERSWTWLFAPYPALRRAMAALIRVRGSRAARKQVEATPGELSAMIRSHARAIGINEIGFAATDVRYNFAEAGEPRGENVIVCVLEQDYEATQTAPSARAERAAFRAYGQLASRIADLAEYVQSLGYDAYPNEFLSGGGLTITYAVEAGLGQLGLNGQLLTPMAGSRCRLGLIQTNAPVELGKPVDFGIPRICDECQICVRRCPVGAIPKTRRDKRGVLKASIKPERCWPTLAQAHGCAVCMKVCPVQRYGLEAVTEHFERTGEIIGKRTDDLEGYVWPLDGIYYGPSDSPPVDAELITPDGWLLDTTRTEAPPVPVEA